MIGKLVHRRVTPGINYFAGNHLYTSMERGTVGVKCLVQEENKLHGQGSNADRISILKNNCIILLLYSLHILPTTWMNQHIMILNEFKDSIADITGGYRFGFVTAFQILSPITYTTSEFQINEAGLAWKDEQNFWNYIKFSR